MQGIVYVSDLQLSPGILRSASETCIWASTLPFVVTLALSLPLALRRSFHLEVDAIRGCLHFALS